MATPISHWGVTEIDYSKEKSNMSLAITTITPANQIAELALLSTLLAAVEAVTMGYVTKDEVVLVRTINAGTLPTDPNAQREKKYLVRYHSPSQGKSFQTELPCADLTFLATNSDFMDESLAEYTNLKAAFEAVVVSPDDASAVIMDTVQFVGRRL